MSPRLAHIVPQGDTVLPRRERPRFGHKRLASLPWLDFDGLASATDHQARLINRAIQIARRNKKLHWLFTRIITAGSRQADIRPWQKLCTRQEPLQQRNPKAMVRDFTIF